MWLVCDVFICNNISMFFIAFMPLLAGSSKYGILPSFCFGVDKCEHLKQVCCEAGLLFQVKSIQEL